MSTTNSLLGLDRKQMEAARLARAAQRQKRSAENDGRTKLNSGRAEKRVRIDRALESAKEHSSDASLSTAVEAGSPPTGIQSKAAQTPATSKPAASTPTTTPPTNASLQYPTGILKRTWAFGHPRSNDIKIEEVLQKNTLNIAVISSWQWDFDWLMSKFVPGKTKYVFVMEGKGESEIQRRREEFKGLESVVRLVFPPMSKSLYSRMHSKLMLLFHPSHLRIVVPSANPTKHDWGESGLLENSCFLIDLPRLPTPQPQSASPRPTSFQISLKHLLRAQTFPSDVLAGLDNFDFSKTRDVEFIHSIPGTYSSQEEIVETGLPSLAIAIRAATGEDRADHGKISVEYATSSLGSLDHTQVATFVRASRGGEPFDALRNNDEATEHSETSDGKTSDFRIIFPTKSTVQNSTGGPNAAGTIFLPSKTYNKSTFPRRLLHGCTSSRSDLLSHNKIILTHTPSTAHLYHGSANLSSSAWGRLSLSKPSKKIPIQSEKMVVANWECGVLLPIVSSAEVNEQATKEKAKEKGKDVSLEDVKKVLLDRWGFELPWTSPARRYGDDDVPWTQDM